MPCMSGYCMPIEGELGTRRQPGKSGQDVQVVSSLHMALL